MDQKNIYLFLFVCGTIVPYSFFIPFLLQNGLNLALIGQLLFANQISTLFVVDLLISGVIFFVYIYFDRKASNVSIGKIELSIFCTLLIGLSAGYPLYMYFRSMEEISS